MRKTHPASEAQAATRHGTYGQPKARRDFAIGHDAKQSVILRRPVMDLPIELWNLELNTACFHGLLCPTQAIGQLSVGHRSHQLIFLARIGSEMAADPAKATGLNASEQPLSDLFRTGSNIELTPAMRHRFRARAEQRRDFIVRPYSEQFVVLKAPLMVGRIEHGDAKLNPPPLHAPKRATELPGAFIVAHLAEQRLLLLGPWLRTAIGLDALLRTTGLDALDTAFQPGGNVGVRQDA